LSGGGDHFAHLTEQSQPHPTNEDNLLDTEGGLDDPL